jgi:hypothetical protein
VNRAAANGAGTVPATPKACGSAGAQAMAGARPAHTLAPELLLNALSHCFTKQFLLTVITGKNKVPIV